MSSALDALAIVIGAGWLAVHQLRKVECTCLHACRESRRQIARRVQVTLDTPRTLWCVHASTPETGGGTSSTHSGNITRPNKRAADSGSMAAAASGRAATGRGAGIHKFSWHGKSDRNTAPVVASATTPSSVAVEAAAAAAPSPTLPAIVSPTCSSINTVSRVPLARVVGIIWKLPVTELVSLGFRWPRGVKELQFWGKFDDPVNEVVFPDTLEALSFGYQFNRSLGPGCVRWPSGLKHLKLGAKWNRRLVGAKDSWPASLEVLHFGTGFDKPLRGGDGIGLPPGLLELHLGGVFDQPLAEVEWPASLQKVTFSEYFNQSLEYRDGKGVLFPKGLREIVFGGRFNQEINRVAWPEGLRTLIFGDNFNQAFVSPDPSSSVDAGGGRGGSSAGGARAEPTNAFAAGTLLSRSPSFSLPDGLRVLVLGDNFNFPMIGAELPDGLETVVIGESFSFLWSVRWPTRLKRLELACSWRGFRGGGGGGGDHTAILTLPKGLEYLDVGDHFNSPLDRIAFPASLKVLVLGSAFNYPLDQVIGNIGASSGNDHHQWQNQGQVAQGQRRGGGRGQSSMDVPVPSPLLPEGLEELRLGAAFNCEIRNARLPETLKRLLFTAESKFDRPVAGIKWPPGLEELRFGNWFDQPMNSLGGGDFGISACGSDSAVMLPSTLRQLHFGWTFSHSLQGLMLPQSLRRLSFSAEYPVSHVRGLEWPPFLQSISVGSFRFGCRGALAKWAAQSPF